MRLISLNRRRVRGQSPRDEKFVRFAILRAYACSVGGKYFKKKFICKLANRKSLRSATFVSIFRQEFCEPQLKSQPEFRKNVIDRCSNVISEVLSLQ